MTTTDDSVDLTKDGPLVKIETHNMLTARVINAHSLRAYANGLYKLAEDAIAREAELVDVLARLSKRDRHVLADDRFVGEIKRVCAAIDAHESFNRPAPHKPAEAPHVPVTDFLPGATVWIPADGGNEKRAGVVLRAGPSANERFVEYSHARSTIANVSELKARIA